MNLTAGAKSLFETEEITGMPANHHNPDITITIKPPHLQMRVLESNAVLIWTQTRL
jgi:hypothetical protein